MKRPATHYLPVKENVTPTVSPARVAETDPATPSPMYCPGKGRGRGKGRTQETQDVGARTKTTPAESQATQAQALHASWPDKRNDSLQITRLARDLQLRDPRDNRFTDIQMNLTAYKIDENKNDLRPPAAVIHSHQQNVFFIPPAHAGGGAVGVSTPVSTVPLGLIHHVDPLLATQGSSLTDGTRHTPESTINHAPRAHRPAWSTCVLTTVGRGPAFSGRTVRDGEYISRNS